MLQIYNSLTKKKEPFRPRQPGKVGIYVCGMTVYDLCHLGHARVLVVFDVIVRYLRTSGFDVTYVRNITDIDDKIIKRARENGEEVESLTITDSGGTHVTLAKTPEGWGLPEAGDYPADNEKVSSLLEKLEGIKTDRQVTRTVCHDGGLLTVKPQRIRVSIRIDW